MNFVESNGSKVAAVLCVASCFPVVATIYAMETQVGSNNDVNTNVAKADENAWQEITGTSPVITEDTNNVAKVSTALSDDVDENVIRTSQEYIKETTQVEETVEVSNEEMEEVLFAEPASFQVETTVKEEAQPTLETYAEPEEEYVEEAVEETVTEEAAQEATEEDYIEEATGVEAADESEVVEEAEADAEYEMIEELPQEESTVEVASESEETFVEAAVEEPVVEEVAVEETATETVYEEEYVEPEVASDPIYEDTVVTSTSTGQDIANAALSLVGVTDGWQCTEVASYALALAGVEGVPVCWPDQYQYYGTVSYEAVVGSLAYYDNGGRGVDHIAVYIGDGECVHGNFDGQTIVYSEDTYSGSPDYYVVFE